MTPGPSAERRLAILREILVERRAGKKERLAALKSIAEMAGDASAGALLGEALAAPVNAPILKYVLRAFGYLGLREVIPVLAPYVRHSDPGVVTSTMKSLAMLDRPQAVQVALPVLRSSSTDTASAAAKVLALRCREESLPQIAELALSARSGDRLAALVYARFLPGAEALPLLVALLRTETDPEVAAVTIKLLPRIVTRSEASPLEALVRELRDKLVRLEGALRTLPDVLERSALTAPDRDQFAATQLDLEIPGRGLEAGDDEFPSEIVRESEAAPKPPPPVPVPPAATHAPAPPASPAPTAQPDAPGGRGGAFGAVSDSMPAAAAAAPPRAVEGAREIVATIGARGLGRRMSVGKSIAGLLPPWIRKQIQKERERRQQEDAAAPAPAPGPGPAGTAALRDLDEAVRGRPAIALAIFTVVAYLLFLLLNQSREATPGVRIGEILECALGKVGERITFTGELVQVHRDYNIIVLKSDKNFIVSAYFDRPVSDLARGKTTTVQGVLKEIKSDRVVVIQGETVAQR
jgi:hypothetical protein